MQTQKKRNKLEILLDQLYASTSLQEALKPIWDIQFYFKETEEINESIIQHLEYLDYKKAKEKIENIYSKISQTMAQKGTLQNFIEESSEEEQIAPWNILKLLTNTWEEKWSTLEAPMIYQLKEAIEESKTLNHTYIDQIEYWERKIAEKTMQLFLNEQPLKKTAFYEKYRCHSENLLKASAILENINSPLYEEYLMVCKQHKDITSSKISKSLAHSAASAEKRRSEQLMNSTEEETMNLLASGSLEYASTFCKLHHLNETLFFRYTEGHSERLYELVKASEDEKTQILDNFKAKLKQEILWVAHEMYVKINQQKENPEQEIPFFDLYEYSKKSNISIPKLISTAELVDCPNSKKIISYYMKQHRKMFDPMKERHINSFGQANYISCDNCTIYYTSKEYNAAIKDMRENHLPNYRGVLFGAILNQTKKRSKEKVKQYKKENI